MNRALAALGEAPAAALVLGCAGLVPFAGLALLAAIAPQWGYAYWLATLAQYGAVILSFVGALGWGYAVRDGVRGALAWWRYGASVVPALAGWLSLQTPVWTALRLQALVLVVVCLLEHRGRLAAGAPAWLSPLRYLLSMGAAACLVAASVA